jgi:Xaa-Pro aminopeptidase
VNIAPVPLPLEASQWIALRQYRLRRVQDLLDRRGIGAVVLFDPHNVRYATGSRNMAVWTLHNHVRYSFVPANGLPVLFEFGAGKWPVEAEALESVGEIRPTRSWTHFYAGSEKPERVKRWADEIADLMRQYCGAEQSIAFDHLDPMGLHEIERRGFNVIDGEALMEQARMIKSSEEISCIRHAIQVAETGMEVMQEQLLPGITENQLWSHLHQTNIAHNGEWIETRLLSSGPRTNPWMQESSDRVIKAGELVAFDTDMIGPNGYCADISRTWLCGDGQATAEQRRLYGAAGEQIQHNIGIMKPGRTLADVVRDEWPIPAEFLPYRYGVAHGVGLKDEYPFLVNAVDLDELGDPDLELQPGMVLSLESYIGAVGGKEGVKLEEQLLVTDGGCELLSRFPLDERLLG